MPMMINCLGSALHVSAKGLANLCPASLQRAIDPTNHEHDVWLSSYMEEKQSLIDVRTYEVITLE